MADSVRKIILILSAAMGVIFLQAPIHWVAKRCSPLETDRAAIPSEFLDYLKLNTLTSRSDDESKEIIRTFCKSSESTSVKTESSKPDLKQRSNASFRSLSTAHHAFVFFNTYRYSLQTFHVLGTTSVIVREWEKKRIRLPVYRCEWVPNNGSQLDFSKSLTTDAKMLYVQFDENGETYVPAVVNCTFNQTVGEDNLGGLLSLHLSNGPNFWGPHFDIERVFEEKPQSVKREFLEGRNEPAFKQKYAFCGPPLHSAPSMSWIQKWLAYHHYMWQGSVHFFFYDVGGVNDAGREMLDPWVKAGLLTIVDARGAEPYPSWYYNQVLLLNDCLYRARFTSRWVFFMDLDEFIHIPAPNTLESLLETNKNVPWMSFGSIPANLDSCRENKSANEWPLERMVWQNKQPECMDKKKNPWLCLASEGRRKVVVNPEKVMLVGVHKTAIPDSETSGGIDFNGTIARLYHYRGGLKPSKIFCTTLVSESDDGPSAASFQFDDSLASIASHVRKGVETWPVPRLT